MDRRAGRLPDGGGSDDIAVTIAAAAPRFRVVESPTLSGQLSAEIPGPPGAGPEAGRAPGKCRRAPVMAGRCWTTSLGEEVWMNGMSAIDGRFFEAATLSPPRSTGLGSL
jgi:hypothetical protein